MWLRNSLCPGPAWIIFGVSQVTLSRPDGWLPISGHCLWILGQLCNTMPSLPNVSTLGQRPLWCLSPVVRTKLPWRLSTHWDEERIWPPLPIRASSCFRYDLEKVPWYFLCGSIEHPLGNSGSEYDRIEQNIVWRVLALPLFTFMFNAALLNHMMSWPLQRMKQHPNNILFAFPGDMCVSPHAELTPFPCQFHFIPGTSLMFFPQS